MWKKVKALMSFLWSAWRGSVRGKIGVALILFSVLILVRLFLGDVSIQKIIGDKFRLGREEIQLEQEKYKLHQMEKHISLLQNRSPDYVEELAQKHLNIGSPNVRVLK